MLISDSILPTYGMYAPQIVVNECLDPVQHLICRPVGFNIRITIVLNSLVFTIELKIRN